jgi:serine protease AprX
MEKRRWLRRVWSWLAIGALAASSLAGAVSTVSASSPTVRMIVQANSLTQAAQAVTANAGQVVANIDIINAVVANVPQANLAALAQAPGVLHAQRDQPVQTAGNSQGEPEAGDFAYEVGADQVWASGNLGQDVTVAFLDTGIDPTFISLRKGPGLRDLDNRLLAYYDVPSKKLYTQPRLLLSPGDPNGHGTHVAGIVGNSQHEPGDRSAYRGIAPQADLVAVRVLDETGVGSYSNVLQGLNWVVQNKDRYHIRVLNVSMYATPVAPYWADPYNLAVMAAWKAGIVVVASAGNGGPAPLSIGVPGNTPYIITVGAFTDNYTPDDFGDDYMPPFSATGPTLDAFVKPDLIAPGAHVVSLMRPDTYLAKHYPDNKVRGSYFKMNGTSMSAAVVSGVVALMLHQDPTLTPDQVKYRLAMTARPQFSERTGEAAYSIWQQGAGRVWAPDAVFKSNIVGSANQGMDLAADLAGTAHYEGWSFFDPTTNEFRIRGDGYNSWSGGYNSWSGGYNSWSGGYNSWSGGTTNWSGGFNSWSDGYNSWSGGYNSWSGGYNSWSGGYNSWSGGYNSWSGGYNSWSGGYSSWSGGYNSWSGGYNSWSGSTGDPAWAAAFAQLANLPTPTSAVSINWVGDDR